MDNNTARLLNNIDRKATVNYNSSLEELNALLPTLGAAERQNVEVVRYYQGTIEALNAARRGFTASR